MNLYVVAVSIPLVFGAELADKTMFASLILALRGRPQEVWVGAATAFLAQVTIAVSFGPLLFALIPRGLVTQLLAVSCIIGGSVAWHSSADWDPESPRMRQRGRSVFFGTFCVIFLAEMGDVTQLLTASLATRFRSPLSVGLGAVVALWLAAALAVTGARPLVLRLSPRLLHKFSAAIIIGFGLATSASFLF